MREKLSAAALIKTRTWSTDEVRQMMNEAIAAERGRCAAWVRHWRDHAYQSADVLQAIENGRDVGMLPVGKVSIP